MDIHDCGQVTLIQQNIISNNNNIMDRKKKLENRQRRREKEKEIERLKNVKQKQWEKEERPIKLFYSFFF